MKPQVVVVDDDADNASALSELLAADGFAPVQFLSGEAAWGALAGQTLVPQAVVADIRMPGLDGVGLLRRVKARFTSLPVILVSAFPEDAVWEEGLRAGALDIFAKPIQGAALVRTLREAVAGSRADVRPDSGLTDPGVAGDTERRMGR